LQEILPVETEISDVTYGNWLIMARAGLLALEFYSPDTKSWRQVCLFSFGYLYIRSFFVGFSWDSYMHMCLLTLYITCEAIFPGIFVAQTQNRGSSFFAFV